ncbi:TnsA endonuclease N-terminal domain-containing protein [Solemya velum gill symbiont]|uniref:TnsA endonuclease N-terminal domain-containing protein n=1 Tax=Solemya velum gill symbiont TaxID=2340 RepID=UPI002118A7B2|nr:TnsA endonuclease N-terminal domain-containing protein [Solemya velum gill symbiont]
MSDLELAAFFLFDWNPSVTDIREQYPLRLEDTIELAAQARIRHPEVRGQIQVMSTDFLVDTNKPERPRMAIQVKTSSDLSNPRTIEKLELERRYWALKEVPWYLLTEKQIPKTVTKNIAWLYPAQLVLDGIEDTLNMASLYLSCFINHPALLISQVAMMLDQAYLLSPGESLQKIRSLLALRVFLFDIRKPWSTLTVGELQASSDIESLRNYYVANQ